MTDPSYPDDLRQYCKKTATVQAWRFDPDSKVQPGAIWCKHKDRNWENDRWFIQTIRGDLKIFKGDWIIFSPDIEIDVQNDDMFRKTYEEIPRIKDAQQNP